MVSKLHLTHVHFFLGLGYCTVTSWDMLGLCLAKCDNPTLLTGSLASRTAVAAASVESFLQRTYWSLGETLPHEWLGSWVMCDISMGS